MGLNFYIVMYDESLKIFSRTAATNGTIFSIIPMTRRFKFVQIKSMGS